MVQKCARKSKKGGALLGEGTYGCVFHPSIPCETEKTSRKGVGKILVDRHEAQEEFEIMNKIQKIDPNHKYVNPILHKCDVEGPKLETYDPDSKKCRLFNKNKRSTFGSVPQLIYKDKGRSLEKYNKSSQNSLFTSATLREYLNLAKGCELLAKHKIVHRDLKPDNVIRTDAGTLIMIDFGLSTSFDEVFSLDQSTLLEANYFVFPPEFAMSVNIAFGKDKVKAAKDHLNNYSFANRYEGFKEHFLAVGLDHEIMNNQLEDFTNHLLSKMEFNKQPNKNGVFQMFKEYANKIDVWSMGMVLLSGFVSNTNQNVLKINCSIRDGVARIIRGCLHANPVRRFSPKELVKEMEELIKTNGVKSTSTVGTAFSKQSSPKKPNIASKSAPTPPKASAVTPPKASAVTPNKLRECMRTHSLSDLKTKMRERRLKVTGNKPVLCERLLTYVPKKN